MKENTFTPPHIQYSDKQAVVTSGRLPQYDLLKGIAILMVVYGHVDVQLLWHENSSVMNSVFAKITMPLFFFLSGFFLYSNNYNLQLITKRGLNRLISQLYPCIIIFSLFILIFMDNSVSYYLFTENKGGYWFIFVSIEYFFFVAPLFIIFSKFNTSVSYRILVMIAIACLSYIVYYDLRNVSQSIPGGIAQLLCLAHFSKYLPYLLLGCSFKAYKNVIERGLFKLKFIIIMVCVFIGSLLSANVLTNSVLSLASIGIMMYLSNKVPQKWFDTQLGKIILFIGTMTLEIYLIHYFIIALLQHVDAIPAYCIPFCNTALEFPVYMSLSLIIVGLSLLIVYILKFLMIYGLVFPKADNLPNQLILNKIKSS